MADDYVELAGRRVRKEPTRWVYRVTGVATLITDSTAPKPKATLSGTTHTIAPICQAVETDEERYPGRILFMAMYEAPLTRTEFQA
jgi:hypothetical protein